jgi:hypothetical protein
MLYFAKYRFDDLDADHTTLNVLLRQVRPHNPTGVPVSLGHGASSHLQLCEIQWLIQKSGDGGAEQFGADQGVADKAELPDCHKWPL